MVAFSILPRRSWLFWLRLVFYLVGVGHGVRWLIGRDESIMLTPIRKPTLTRGRYAYHKGDTLTQLKNRAGAVRCCWDWLVGLQL